MSSFVCLSCNRFLSNIKCFNTICGHLVCEFCVKNVLDGNRTCPRCLHPLKESKVREVRFLRIENSVSLDRDTINVDHILETKMALLSSRSKLDLQVAENLQILLNNTRRFLESPFPVKDQSLTQRVINIQITCIKKAGRFERQAKAGMLSTSEAGDETFSLKLSSILEKRSQTDRAMKINLVDVTGRHITICRSAGNLFLEERKNCLKALTFLNAMFRVDFDIGWLKSNVGEDNA